MTARQFRLRVAVLTITALVLAAAGAGAVLVMRYTADDGVGATTAIPTKNLRAPVAKKADVKQWSERIKSCEPAEATVIAYGQLEVEQCLYLVYVDAGKKLQWQALGTALRELISEQPLLGNPCHVPAHRAGKYYFQAAGSSIRRALSLYDQNTCESGLMHGIIEAWADTNPSDDEAAELVIACEAYAATEPAQYCAHGVGHAAYNVKQDPIEAARWCALLSKENLRSECGHGVLMNTYLPSVKTRPHRDPANAVNELSQLCRNWPSTELNGMREGCIQGTAFVMSKIGIDEVVRLTAQLPYPFPVLEKPLLDQVRAAAAMSAKACLQMEGDFVDACMESLAHAVPSSPQPIILNPQVRQAMCAAFGKFAQSCIEREKQLV